MKKSEGIRRHTGRMIAKNLIILAVLAVVAFASVVSWFTMSQKAEADGIVVQTQVSDGLEFYIMPPSAADQYDDINARLADNATYNNTNNLSENDPGYRRTTWHTSNDGEVTFDFSDQEFKFMEGLFLCEVTSDGSTFKVPKLMQYDEIAYVDTTQSFDDPTPNDEYMSFDIYFRSESTHDIVLKYDSSITPGDASGTYTTAATYTSRTDIESKKDAAIGAVRMAVLNMEASNERELLWIPGPYVYYDGTAGDDGTLYTGLTSSQYSNKGAAYYDGAGIAKRSGEGTNDHAYYNASKVRQVIRSNASGVVVGSALGSNSSNDITVLTIPVSNHDTTNEYYYGHIRVNLWIEGEDAEARLAFVGGKFKMSLDFEMVYD